MTEWELLPAAAAQKWNSRLASLVGATLYQSYGWGELKRSLGWTVMRLALGELSGSIAMTQVLVRRYPAGGCVCWIPGGPAGNVADWAPRLGNTLQKILSARWVYLRINAMRPIAPAAVGQLQESGWHAPAVRFATGLSLTYDPSLNESGRLAIASTNWRHNLKRSGKYSLVVRRWESPKAEELQAIYRSMERYKGLAETMGDNELASLLDCLRNDIVLYRCDDKEGNTIALRACAILGNEAWDLLAAASPAARKQYASYATLWAVLNECGQRGVMRYDMGGVDPDGNKGVFDFKRGLGAQPLTYLGEWAWTSSAWVRILANQVLRWKSLSL